MATDANKSDARLNFRLPAALKETIEQAATHLGQTVSEFAVSTLVQTARHVIQEHNVTRLTDRDRDRLIALLDDAEARPNKALKAAAKRYRDRG